MIESLKATPYTTVFYEAPHRIQRVLQEILEILGDRQVAVCREMTKWYEEVFRGTLKQAAEHFSKKKPKGEFTVVLGGH